MKRTFTKSELMGQRGYVEKIEGDTTLYIFPMVVKAIGCGLVDNIYMVEERDCKVCGDECLTGEPLVAALRERGVEVVEDTAEANAKPEVDEWGKFELAESPTYHRMGDMVDVYYSDGELMHHKPWTSYANCNRLWLPLTPAEVETFKAKIAAYGKPEVKPTEAEQLRKQLDDTTYNRDQLREALGRRGDEIDELNSKLDEAKATNDQLRETLFKRTNDHVQPPMSDERFLQEAAMKAMCGVVASIPTNERQKEVDNIAEVNGMSVYELVADVSMRYATALLSALKQKEQQ